MVRRALVVVALCTAVTAAAEEERFEVVPNPALPGEVPAGSREDQILWRDARDAMVNGNEAIRKANMALYTLHYARLDLDTLEPYGLVYNPKRLQRLGVPPLKDWDDLLNPAYKDSLQMADARTSGTAVALAQDSFGGANNPAAMAFAGDRFDIGVDGLSVARRPERADVVERRGDAGTPGWSGRARALREHRQQDHGHREQGENRVIASSARPGRSSVQPRDDSITRRGFGRTLRSDPRAVVPTCRFRIPPLPSRSRPPRPR